MSGQTTPDDIQALSFEDAMEELESIVRTLEEGRGQLDEAITAYERGSALKRHCEALLKKAQMRVEKIVLADGDATTEAADLD